MRSSNLSIYGNRAEGEFFRVHMIIMIKYRFFDDSDTILAENNLIHADFATSIDRRRIFFPIATVFWANFALAEVGLSQNRHGGGAVHPLMY